MSSSPEPVSRWEPVDLRAAGGPAAAGPRTGLVEPPVFEVGTPAGVPEHLLTSARAAASAQGYAAGWAHGMRMALQRSTAEAERVRAEQRALLAEQRAGATRAVAALDAAAAALERAALPGAEQVETLLLEAAFGIAEALVGRALRDDATRGPAALARVLALAPHSEPVTVRLSPADHALLAGAQRSDETGRRITLVADPTLEPGDAVATCGATEVESRIRAGLLRVREALGQ